MSVTARYEQSPQKWNLGIVITLGTILWGAAAFFLTTLVDGHNVSIDSHSDIRQEIFANGKQLDRVEANQIKEQAMQMDARLCDDPDNTVYRNYLSELISQWEKITGQTFPRELLRCA